MEYVSMNRSTATCRALNATHAHWTWPSGLSALCEPGEFVRLSLHVRLMVWAFWEELWVNWDDRKIAATDLQRWDQFWIYVSFNTGRQFENVRESCEMHEFDTSCFIHIYMHIHLLVIALIVSLVLICLAQSSFGCWLTAATKAA